MKCQEQSCDLEFQNINEIYYHLLADHYFIPCPICTNTLLHPKNFQRHLIQKHNVNWESQQFTDIFVDKFGYEESLFYFLREISGFMPLSILRNIIKRMGILSKGLIEVTDGYYITPSTEKKETVEMINGISQLDLMEHYIKYLTGKKPHQIPFLIRLGLTNLEQFRDSLSIEILSELVIVGLRLSRTSKLYINASKQLSFVLNEIDEIKDSYKRVTLLFEAIRYFSHKDKRMNELKNSGWAVNEKKSNNTIFYRNKLKKLIHTGNTINKDKFLDQISLIKLLTENNIEQAINHQQTISKSYHSEFSHSRACDFLTLGKLYNSIEEYKKAKKMFYSAQEIFERQQDYVRFIECGKNLIYVYLKLEEHSEAIKNAKYILESVKDLNIAYITKLGLKFGNLDMDYHLIKDYEPKTLEDVDRIRRKIDLSSKMLEEIYFDIEEGYLDDYDVEEVAKVEERLKTIEHSFLDINNFISQSETKIITSELIELGLSTFSSLDKNFNMPNPILRERLYNILTSVENIISYRFNHPHLLWQALLDTELKDTMKGSPSNKLAFLGDAALKLAISEIILEHGKVELSLDELSKEREKIEKNANLALIFDRLNLEKFILSVRNTLPLKASETGFSEVTVVKWKGTMVESIIGAIYFDGGLSAVKRFLVGWKPQLFVNLYGE